MSNESRLFRISVVVDEEWLRALDKFTSDVHPGEVCQWGASIEIDDADEIREILGDFAGMEE